MRGCRVLGGLLFLGCMWSLAADEPKPKTISKLMKEAFLSPYNRGSKNNLDGKILQGRATLAEQQQFLTLMKALAEHQPPKGSVDDWKTRTTELVAATEAMLTGEANALQRFKKARDCRACHVLHRPDR